MQRVYSKLVFRVPMMFDYEGSRSEFLKLLAELGEEPAFIARAKAPQNALDELLRRCGIERQKMLKWPRLHLAHLAELVSDDWAEVATLIIQPSMTAELKTLQTEWGTDEQPAPKFLATPRRVLGQYCQSAERFNRGWIAYLQTVDLKAVNVPRDAFNRYYLVEKECAFGAGAFTSGFEPLEMIDSSFLRSQFPLLPIPQLK